MGFTQNTLNLVRWQCHFSTLQPFLQGRFTVFLHSRLVGTQRYVSKQPFDKDLRWFKTSVDIHGTNNRLHSVSQYGRARAPAALVLAFA